MSAQIITALVLWELQLWLGKLGFPWQSGKTDLGQLKVGGRKEIESSGLAFPFSFSVVWVQPACFDFSLVRWWKIKVFVFFLFSLFSN